MRDPCYFDDSLPRLVRVLAGKLDRAQIEAGVVLRDAGGRLCFFNDRDVAPATALEISAEIKAVLGPYARPDRLAVGSGEPGAQRVLQDPAALPVTVDLGDGEVLTVRYLDRRIVGADWLQPPSSPLEPAAPENEVAPGARTLRVAFSSLKGGVGRSTALTVVAAEQARKGRNVLVIDLDLEAPGIGSLLLSEDRMPGFGAIDYLLERNFGAVDRAIVSDMVGTSALTQG
ncbi:MAG TPA: AAA family ATPase, partial [Kofleriaceae bacterium]|nr:AAA family ATPase [Kofleriaceae bacterium]